MIENKLIRLDTLRNVVAKASERDDIDYPQVEEDVKVWVNVVGLGKFHPTTIMSSTLDYSYVTSVRVAYLDDEYDFKNWGWETLSNVAEWITVFVDKQGNYWIDEHILDDIGS